MTAQEIKDLRINLGRSRESMAKILGTTELSIHRWETGKNRPLPVFMVKLKKLQAWVAGQQAQVKP